MITAYTLDKALATRDEAARVAKSEMPGADFVFVGFDNDFVYFNLVAQKTTFEQQRDIIAKTRFMPVNISDTSHVYIGNFKIAIL